MNKLGWSEEVPFEEGLQRTVAWYEKYSGNWEDVESALVAHPRRGFTGKAWRGKQDDESTPDAVEAILKERTSGAATAGAGH